MRTAIKLLVPDQTLVDIVRDKMETHLVYILCSADAIYTNIWIGGDGVFVAGSVTPTIMGAGVNRGPSPSKWRRSDD